MKPLTYPSSIVGLQPLACSTRISFLARLQFLTRRYTLPLGEGHSLIHWFVSTTISTELKRR
jgi:hypothetical protein